MDSNKVSPSEIEIRRPKKIKGMEKDILDNKVDIPEGPDVSFHKEVLICWINDHF